MTGKTLSQTVIIAAGVVVGGIAVWLVAPDRAHSWKHKLNHLVMPVSKLAPVKYRGTDNKSYSMQMCFICDRKFSEHASDPLPADDWRLSPWDCNSREFAQRNWSRFWFSTWDDYKSVHDPVLHFRRYGAAGYEIKCSETAYQKSEAQKTCTCSSHHHHRPCLVHSVP